MGGGLACLALLPVGFAVLLCRLRFRASRHYWCGGDESVDCGECGECRLRCGGCVEYCGGCVEWKVDVWIVVDGGRVNCGGWWNNPHEHEKNPRFMGDHSTLNHPCNNPCHRPAKLSSKVQIDPFMLTSIILISFLFVL